MNKKYLLSILFLVIVIDSMGMGLAYPIFAPLFSAKINGIFYIYPSVQIRNFLYGLTLLAFPISIFFSLPILGDLSDTVGRKKILMFCLYGSSAAMFLSGIAIILKSVFLLITAQIIAGTAAGSISIAQAAIIDISTDRDKTTNISLIALANVIGFVLGPLMSGVLANGNLVKWFGFSTPFFVAAFLAFFNASLIILTFQETFYQHAKQKIRLLKGIINLSTVFKYNNLRILMFIYLLVTLGWALCTQFLPLYLVQQYNYSVPQVGNFMAWLAIAMSFALLVIIRIFIKICTPGWIAFYAMTMAIIGTAIIMRQISLFQWIGVAPIAIGMGLSYGSLRTLLSDSVDKKSQGWIMGTATSIYAISSQISAILISIFTFFSLKIPFIVTMMAFLGGAILIFFWNVKGNKLCPANKIQLIG